jgi:protein TonB
MESNRALAPPPVSKPRTQRRLGRALGLSAGLHAGLAAFVVIFMSIQPERVTTQVPPLRLDVVYLPLTGPGGGGGGNPAPAPPRPVEVPHHETPAAIPLDPVPVVKEPPPQPTLDVPIETNAATLLQASGSSAVALTGPGGGGRGPGVGPGSGPGVGDGSDGGRGGGPRQPGAGVTAPTLIRSVEPKYTAGALVAKLQGSVELDVVVLPNGTVGEVHVARSLDRAFGLDQEAIAAARQWLFRPGTAQGKPVDVLVKIVLDFRIH